METQRHQLLFELAAEAAYVIGDQKRLVQIVSDLLNNATKYTPPGGIIRVKLGVEPDRLILSVEDNGIGIPDDLQAHVFELFTQADRTSDRTQGGLGIGLALVKNLTELHVAAISCFSEGMGRGSRFSLSLPRYHAPMNTARVEAGTLPELRRSKHPRRILVVDDNAGAAQMLAMYLETLGHHVFTKNSSVRAMECTKLERPDVCIIDIGLPGMDGNELAGRLRMEQGAAHAFLIAVTGYGQEHDKRNSMAAGLDRHLVKPVDAGTLADLLDEYRR